MILALNTAQTEHELALLSSPSPGPIRLLAEHRWQNAKEDVEKLVPTLQALLEAAAARKEDLTDLVVVRGPGSFTSLRVGIAFINALHEGLRQQNPQLRLHSLTTFELLALKATHEAQRSALPLLTVLPAGGLDVSVKIFNENGLNKPLIDIKSVPGHTFQVGPLAPLLAKLPHDPTLRVAVELPETLQDELHSIALEKSWQLFQSHELLTLGEALQIADLSTLTPHDEPVTPLYLKSANITVSKDPWKRAK